MAHQLTPRRALLLALLAGGTLGLTGTLAFRPREYVRVQRNDPLHRAERGRDRVEAGAARAVDDYRLLVLFDSLTRAGAATPAAAEGLAAMGYRILNSLRPRLGLEETAIPLRLHMVVDSATTFRGLGRPWRPGRTWHLLPTAEDPVCRVVITVGDADPTGPRTARNLQRTLPGICGLVAAFGLPGDSIRAWLGRTGARFATDVNWTPTHAAVSEPMVRTERPTVWYVARGFRFERTAWGAAPLCFVGREGRCAQWVLDSVPTRGGAAGLARAITITRPFWWTGSTGGRLLGDLLRREGPERFATFWRSNENLADAFAAAFGTPLDRWVREWTWETLIPRPRDATIGWSVWLGSLLLAALFGGWGLLYASRRTVSA